MKRYILPVFRRLGLLNETLMDKVSRFVACEIVDGDYYEFGVFQGASFIKAYHAFENGFANRINQRAGSDDISNQKRMEAWRQMRFFAFDSFEGLPELESGDDGTEDFRAGMYTCSVEGFQENLRQNRVPLERVQCIKGWFSETCNLETIKKYELRKASVIWVDGDLYSSTRDVLSFVSGLLQDGTVIIFDDWFSYRGNPARGEQLAFREWIEMDSVKSRFTFQEYQKESWKRIAFIASERVEKSTNF